MSDASRLPDLPWVKSDLAERLFDALEGADGEGRFAGGCVRDALLGRTANDIDVATTVHPEDVIKALEAAGIKAVPTGIDHGTITAVLDGAHIEVTTLREDIETDGRHAVVRFAEDWEVDSSRRDFTINALYADRNGEIFDYQGGLQDLADKRVRFIGSAVDRIHEDALRILRFYRFSAWYAQLPLDEEGHAASKTHQALLAGLSAERVTNELLKLMAAPAPQGIIQDMIVDGILEGLLPVPLALGDMSRVAEIESELGEVDAIRRLSALIGGDVDIRQLAEDRKLSNNERSRLLAMAAGADVQRGMSWNETRRRIYRHGAEAFADWVLLAWARSNDERNHTAWESLYRSISNYEPVTFPITGKMVMDSGIPEGEQVGAILHALESWWIEGDFTATEAELMVKLRELVS